MGIPREKHGTLESEATSFLLLVAGLFFLLEGLIHYDNFFVTASEIHSATAIILVVGSVAVAALYLALAYSCWKNPSDTGFFAFALVLSVLLSVSYFVLEIVESAGPQFYFIASFNYVQFLSGYGSVTIFVELLIVFFSFRVYRSTSS
jgi:hypothetical protein